MRTVGFIGAGKVACTMGRYLSERGIRIAGYYDTSEASADEAATFTSSEAFTSESAVIAASDVIFIATPDDVIATVWEKIRTMDIKDKFIGIFSGSLSSNLFSGIETTGAVGFSIHPMFAFSDKYSDYRQLHNTMFAMEGDPHAVEVIRALFEGLGHTVSVIDSDKKYRYHAAASVASNLMVGLFDMSLVMLTDCGFSEEEARAFLSPIVEKNTTAMLEMGPIRALTGPIERGDIGTVKHHLEVLSKEERAVYLPLARRLVEISKEKNPTREYEQMERILEG
ncbi:MAG: DUF2520 domain-containing protein [Eubacterium sp.]|nr:DUF2520 domain-containing protein [Eubacterium sp.]